MYKDTPFERRPAEEIVQDIQRAKEIHGPHATTFFFGDSNSLILDAGILEQILHSLYDNFQNIDRVTSYARAKTLCKKSLEDLRRIRKAGLTRLHIGLETGDAELLTEIRKGATPDQMVEGCVRAREAGFEVSLYVLAGIGGEAKWRQHATGTADVINRADPHFIRIRTYVPTPYSSLYDREKNNQFQLASPETILREQYLLIDLLEVTSQYLSDHISNYVPVYGNLPDDKARMLETLDRAIEDLSSNESYRRSLEMKRHLTHL